MKCVQTLCCSVISLQSSCKDEEMQTFGNALLSCCIAWTEHRVLFLPLDSGKMGVRKSTRAVVTQMFVQMCVWDSERKIKREKNPTHSWVMSIWNMFDIWRWWAKPSKLPPQCLIWHMGFSDESSSLCLPSSSSALAFLPSFLLPHYQLCSLKSTSEILQWTDASWRE